MTSHRSTETSAYSNTASTTTPSIYTSLNDHAAMSELVAELKDPLSFWQEIRITPMSGTDYVFVPNFIYQAFGGSYCVARFVSELSTAFEIEPSRLQLVCRNDKANEDWSYGKTIIEWGPEGVSHSHLEVIPAHSKFHEFIDSMFQYSLALVTQLEH
ncbi:MAG TPA: hypothetical protein VIC26_08640 [Marinagarivorans sp.]